LKHGRTISKAQWSQNERKRLPVKKIVQKLHCELFLKKTRVSVKKNLKNAELFFLLANSGNSGPAGPRCCGGFPNRSDSTHRNQWLFT